MSHQRENEGKASTNSYSFKDLLEMLQSAATIAAIVVGSLWALYLYKNQREDKPRLNIEHSVQTINLNEDYNLIHLTISHENKGNTLINLKKEEIRLQRVMPISDSIASTISNGSSPIEDDDRVVKWPLLCRRVLSNSFELEPNEKHESVNEFLIPSYIELVKIYTYYPNKEKDKIGWSKTTMQYLEDQGDDDEINIEGEGFPPHICIRDANSPSN